MSFSRYEVEAPFYDYVYDRTDDIPFYLEYCAKSRGPIMEVCSGTGRLLIPIARAGYQITGLDNSSAMMNVCLAKLAKEKLAVQRRVRLVKEDMREFELRRRFGLVFIPYASFLHNTTVEEEESTLRCIARHTSKDGLLILEVFNPNPDRPEELLRLDRVKPMPSGGSITRFSSQTFDKANQLTHSTLVYDIVDSAGGVKRHIAQTTLRYIFKDELAGLLKRCGYEVEETYGSVKKDKFDYKKSPMIVVVARKVSKEVPW